MTLDAACAARETVRTYFDSNVYRHLAEHTDAGKCRMELRAAGCSIVASTENLLEVYAIPDETKRRDELKVLVEIASGFEKRPVSYLEATQVRLALLRHRPDWRRSVVFRKTMNRQLADYGASWKEAVGGILPDAGAYGAYRRDHEAGVATARGLQKTFRQHKLEERRVAVLKRFGDRIASIEMDLDNPDTFWRVECWLAYDGALVQQHSATRDLSDWIRPFLRANAISSADLFTFWMRDVSPDEVPRARWSGVVSFFQLDSKIGHGHANDQLHAAHALDTDVFVTADRGLHRALVDAKSFSPVGVARVLLWRRAASPHEALATFLEEIRGGSV